VKKTLIALTLLLALGLFVGCDEEAAVVEDIPTDVIPEAGSVPAAVIGQWVEYDIEEAGIVKLALVGKEEFEGAPCYWLEVVVGEEDETIIVHVLIDVEAYEEGISAIQEWLADPMIPDEGMFADMMEQQMAGAMPTDDELDEIYSSMEDILDVVKRLVIQIDAETAFELDLPDLVDMMIGQMEDGMEMMAEFEDMYDDYEEEEYEVEMPEMPELAIVGEEDVKVGEETVRAIHITIDVEGDVVNLYVTPAIPFFGLVKVEADGEVPLMVKDFGQSGAESSMTVENIEKMGAEELMMMIMMGGMGGDMGDMPDFGDMPDMGDMPDFGGMEDMGDYVSPEEMEEMIRMMEELQGS
jgi:hypothetical protein